MFARKKVDPPSLAKKACVEIYDKGDSRADRVVGGEEDERDTYEIKLDTEAELSGPQNEWMLEPGRNLVKGISKKDGDDDDDEDDDDDDA